MSTPPRLAVLAARDAEAAVVLRRRPTDWARLSLWDSATDAVTHGGWLHARVPWRRCDLSRTGDCSSPSWPTTVTVTPIGRTATATGDVTRGWRSAGPRGGTPWPPWFDADADLPAPRPGPAWTDVTVPHNRRVRDGWTEVEPGW